MQVSLTHIWWIFDLARPGWESKGKLEMNNLTLPGTSKLVKKTEMHMDTSACLRGIAEDKQGLTWQVIPAVCRAGSIPTVLS